jgi:hypothetical protein
VDWSSHFATRPFRPFARHVALATRVLTVATSRVEGTWSAYVDAVPGYDHDREACDVAFHGDKLPEGVARALYPEFEGVTYGD